MAGGNSGGNWWNPFSWGNQATSGSVGDTGDGDFGSFDASGSAPPPSLSGQSNVDTSYLSAPTNFSAPSFDFANTDFSTPATSDPGAIPETAQPTSYSDPNYPGVSIPGSDLAGGGVSFPDTGGLGGSDSAGGAPSPNMAGAVPYMSQGVPSISNYGGDYTSLGPAGTGGTPDIGALRLPMAGEGGWDQAVEPAQPLNTAGSPASGISAAGAGALGSAGGGIGEGSQDLSRRNPASGESTRSSQESPSWTSNLGIRNPVGSALAAGMMGYNLMQQRALNNQMAAAGASNPALNIAQLAQQNAATGGNLTPQGTNIAVQGVEDLRSRAAGLNPTLDQLTAAGPGIAQQGATDLRTRAQGLNPTLDTLTQRGTGLTGYVGTGTLPPEMMAQVDQATNDARTARISFYAQRGMPTDPNRNTSLRSDLEKIDQQRLVMVNQMATDLAKTGQTIASTGIQGAGTAGQLEQGAANIGNTMTSTGIQGAGTAGQLERGAGDIGTNMVNAGIRSTGIAQDAYNNLARINSEQTARTQAAIQAMAQSLSGPQTQNVRVVT